MNDMKNWDIPKRKTAQIRMNREQYKQMIIIIDYGSYGLALDILISSR